MSNLELEFSTTDYENSHERKPRGYGKWAFQYERDFEILTSRSMTLTEAKKWLKQELIRRQVKGYYLMKVCA